MDLPVVQPFTIDSLGWECVDLRTLGRRDSRTAERAWTFHITRTLNKVMLKAGDLVCGPKKIDEVTVAYHERLRVEPGLKHKDFIKRDTRRQPTDVDGSRAQLFFGIRRDDGEWIGGLSISNIDIKRDDARGVECCGLPLLGCPDLDGDTAAAWVSFYRDFLNRTLTMADGRSLDVCEYRFMESLELRSRAFESRLVRDFVAGMSTHFDVVGRLERREAMAFRRR